MKTPQVESVKARLKQYAVKKGCTFQEALSYYIIERSLSRVALSRYSNNFILKGGILLYALFEGSYARATTDMDLLAVKIANAPSELLLIFREILSADLNDGVVFDTESIHVVAIGENRNYQGVRVSTVAFLDKTRVPVSIDIGFGDVVYPRPQALKYPTLLKMDPPLLSAYPVESVIAEKVDAIVKNGFLNSRYKDFFDIYQLSRQYDFDYQCLRTAIIGTLSLRKTGIDRQALTDTVTLIDDGLHQRRWESFQRKKKTREKYSLEETIQGVLDFIEPVFSGDTPYTYWDAKKQRWC